jgi:Tol biopolymer transport system component
MPGGDTRTGDTTMINGPWARGIGLALIAMLHVQIAAAQQRSAESLLQEGVNQELVTGDLTRAIATYRSILAQHASNRRVGARALANLGRAYEKLGATEARATYQRLLREYADQVEPARFARGRLAALAAGSTLVSRTDPTVRRIWAGADVDNSGAPTADGTALTYVDWSTGDLAVRDLTTGRNRRLTNKGPWSTSVEFAGSAVPSPDAKRVAYAWFGTNQNVEIRFIGMGGGGEKTVYSTTGTDYPVLWEWTRDGTQVLASFHSKDGTQQIVLVGDSSRKVLKTLAFGGPLRVSLSPDGKVLAYDNSAFRESRQHDLFLLDLETGTESVVAHPATDLLAGWTPDGKNIVFASDRTGNMSLWMLAVTNGVPAQEPQLLRRDAEFTMYPLALTPNGALYYSADASPTDIWVAEIDALTGRVSGRPARVLDRYVGENRNASWSPDGRSIVYISKRQPGPIIGTSVLVRRTLADGVERVVPTNLTLQGGITPAFSRDGQSVVVTGRNPSGRGGLYRIDLETGSETFLFAPGGANSQFAGVVDSGRAVIYLHRDFQTGEKKLVRHSLADSQTTVIYGYTDKKRNMWAPVISPDGSSITFVDIAMDSIGTNSSFGSSINVVSAGGGEAREVLRSPGSFQFRNVAWSPDGRHIYFTRSLIVSDGKGGMTPDPGNQQIMRVPVAGGSVEETGIFADEIQAMRLSPDGKRISYTAGRRSLEVWVMENFLPAPAGRPRSRPN